MPKVSKESGAGKDYGPVFEVAQELDGYTVSFVTFKEDVDATPLMKGLVDDRCQCAHWGLVTKGRVTFRYADRDEIFEAGDAFYTPPGHIPVKHEPGSEMVMFSPTEDLHVTEQAMAKNMQAMQAQMA